MKQATYYEFLEWFYVNADFGPADSDVRDDMIRDFMEEKKKLMPEDWTFSNL